MVRGIFLQEEEIDKINQLLEEIDCCIGSQRNDTNESNVLKQCGDITSAIHLIRKTIGEEY